MIRFDVVHVFSCLDFLIVYLFTDLSFFHVLIFDRTGSQRFVPTFQIRTSFNLEKYFKSRNRPFLQKLQKTN